MVLKIVVLLFISFNLYALSFNHDLEEMNGKNFDWRQGSNKKLLFFWATWCSECKDKLKNDLVKIDDMEDVDVYTINIDKNVKRAKYFIKKKNLSLKVLRDSKRNIQDSLKIVSVPHWVLIEKVNDDWVVQNNENAFDFQKITKILK